MLIISKYLNFDEKAEQTKWQNDTNRWCSLWQKHRLKHRTSSVKFRQLLVVHHNTDERQQGDYNPSASDDSETTNTSMDSTCL